MENFGKIKNIFVLTFLMIVGFCFVFINKASADAGINNVRISEITESSVTLRWTTSKLSWTYIAYKAESCASATKNFDVIGTDTDATVHIKTIGLSSGTTYCIQPRAFENPSRTQTTGNGIDVMAGAPYLISFDSDTNNGTYGPGQPVSPGYINIKATYNKDVSASSTLAVTLNDGAAASIPLGGEGTGKGVSGATVYGAYTVSDTGHGENTTDLNIDSITQNVCDSVHTTWCTTNTVLPPFTYDGNGSIVSGNNFGDLKNIAIDTTAPVYNFPDMASDIKIKSLSDWNYSLADTGSSIHDGKLIFRGTAGDDIDISHTCTLTSSGLLTTSGNTFDPGTMCSDGTIGLVDGSTYSIYFTGTDNYGNSQGTDVNPTKLFENVTYDTNSPALDLFTSTTANGMYEGGASINITANFGENLSSDSVMYLDVYAGESSPIELTVNSNDPKQLIGTYNIGDESSCHNTSNLNIYRIDESSNNKVKDAAGNYWVYSSSPPNEGRIYDSIGSNKNEKSIAVDTTTYSIQYYSNYNADAKTFSGAKGDVTHNPILIANANPYYLKITSTCSLGSNVPTVSIGAQGSANDIPRSGVSGVASSVSGNDYYIERLISYDAAATGAKEDISIAGTSAAGNYKSGLNPTNELMGAAYIDTIPPTVTGTVNFTPTSSNSGTANIALTFSEPMDTGIAPTVTLNAVSASGSFSNSTSWSGTVSIASNFNSGSATLNVSGGQDVAGNVMTSYSNALSYPVVTAVNDGVYGATSDEWMNSDLISVSISGASIFQYGFNSSSTCNGSVTYGSTPYAVTKDGNDYSFTINTDHPPLNSNDPQYLCLKASDADGQNIIYYNFPDSGGSPQNQLHVDATPPNISGISVTKVNGENYSPASNRIYGIGDVFTIGVDFSENITVSQDLVLKFNTGGNGASCTNWNFSDSKTATCTLEVMAGYSTPTGLQASSITNTASDKAGNTLSTTIGNSANFPNQTIVINTTAPVLESFTSSTSNGTYGPDQSINIKATYDKNLANGATITVTLNSGAQVVLDSISDEELSGNYIVCRMDGTVGCSNGDADNDKSISKLAVASIDSQHVCDNDTGNNCSELTGYLPTTNIDNGSSIKIDTTPPAFNITSPVASGNINPGWTLSFTPSKPLKSDNSAKITITRTSGSSDSVTHICTLNESYLAARLYADVSPSNVCQEGAIGLASGAFYNFIFAGTDIYGNTGTDSSITNVSYNRSTDNPPYVVGDITYTVTDTTATITWTTNVGTTGEVDYNEDVQNTNPTYGQTVSGSTSTFITAHSITLSGLTANTTYDFQVRGQDISQNDLDGENVGTFATRNPADKTPPVISNVASSEITGVNAKITWDTDENSDSYVEYGEDQSYGKIFGSDADVKSHTITLPADLKAETTYHFKVTSTDTNNNKAESIDYTFKTLAETIDPKGGGVAPVISNIKVSVGNDPNSMDVTWTTDRSANGLVRFGLDNNFGQTAAEDVSVDSKTSFATSHTVTLTNLLSNTTYYYKVVSYDTSGNIGISANKNFSTSALQILSEPKVANASTKSVVIVWDTLDPSFSGVQYGTSTSYGKTFQDAILANSHRVELTGLSSGQVYHFKIKGGKSSDAVYSKDYLFGTFAKPTVSNFAVSDISDSTVTVKWKVNVPSESSVVYQNKDDQQDKGTKGLDGLQTDNQIKLNGLKQGSKYTAKISGTDVNGNSFESTVANFETLIDTTAPVISQVSTDSSLVTGKEDRVQTIVSWKTDEPSTSQVAYDVNANSDGELGQTTSEDSNLTTNHLVVLTSLKSGTIYHFRVISKDKNANREESQDFTLLTPQKKQSVIQMIIANFEQSFGWVKKLKK